MKLNLSLTTALSSVTISGGMLLATITYSPAGFSCPFSKANSTNTVITGNSPTQVSKKLDFAKLAIAGAGIATVGGLFAAGMSYKARLSEEANATTDETPVLHPEVSADTSFEELLFPPKVEDISSQPKQDLTRIG